MIGPLFQPMSPPTMEPVAVTVPLAVLPLIGPVFQPTSPPTLLPVVVPIALVLPVVVTVPLAVLPLIDPALSPTRPPTLLWEPVTSPLAWLFEMVASRFCPTNPPAFELPLVRVAVTSALARLVEIGPAF